MSVGLKIAALRSARLPYRGERDPLDRPAAELVARLVAALTAAAGLEVVGLDFRVAETYQ